MAFDLTFTGLAQIRSFAERWLAEIDKGARLVTTGPPEVIDRTTVWLNLVGLEYPVAVLHPQVLKHRERVFPFSRIGTKGTMHSGTVACN
jgi:hypothetical protein